jgi:hypothetical protein
MVINKRIDNNKKCPLFVLRAYWGVVGRCAGIQVWCGNSRALATL